jgi:predicted DNA-binding transcriptional regulator AlpA
VTHDPVSDGLRAIAERHPAGAAVIVSLPREWILARLAGDGGPQAGAEGLSVEVVAARFGRRPSTIRNYCARGRFPGAWRLGRSWRIPEAAIENFVAAEANARVQAAEAPRAAAVDLRAVVRRGGAELQGKNNSMGRANA